MAKVGKFLEKHFKNKEVEISIGEELEWISYSDSETFNRTLIQATFIEYDEECEILVMRNTKNTTFYIAEDIVQMFWAPGFKILESIKTTINTGKKLIKKDRDIM
jgi:hypothetical protein